MRREGPAGGQHWVFDLQEGRVSGPVSRSVQADASFLASGELSWDTLQPTHPFPSQRQKTWMDTSWTDTCLSPFTYLPLLPPPNSLFTECSTPLVVWEGYEQCVYMRYACRLKCARRLCLCVPECEITPSGVLEPREGSAASRARCPGCGLVSDTASCTSGMRCTAPPPAPPPHVPDSIWHKILAVTLSVYWLVCPGVADQPLGLREAPSCFPTPSSAAPHGASCGTRMETHTPGSGEIGAQKNHVEVGEGVGNVHYNEAMPPAIHNTVHLERAGKMGGSADRRSPPQARPPERNGHFKCLRESSGSLALAPCSGGGKEEGITGKGLTKQSHSPAS